MTRKYEVSQRTDYNPFPMPFGLVIEGLVAAHYHGAVDAYLAGERYLETGLLPVEQSDADDRAAMAARYVSFAASPAGQRDPRWAW